MFKKTLFIASVSAALLSPISAQEEGTQPEAAPASNPALDAVIEHVPAILDHSWKSSFNVSVHEGESQSLALTAGVMFQDKKHFSIELDLTVEDDFEGEKKMTFSILADGTFLYMDSPSMGEMTQGMANGPVKVELALFEKMMASQMGGGMAPEGTPDKNAMKEMISGALEGFDFKEEGSDETLRRFTLSGEEMNGAISFEKKHWFLSSAEVNVGEAKTVVNATENAMVESFPEGTFTFTAAEGQTVMDLTPMLQMSMPQEEVADDDLEF